MATQLSNIKIDDLTKFQQDFLSKFYPVVEKLFLDITRNGSKSSNSTEQELNPDVLKFLSVMETIFVETLPKYLTSQDPSTEEFILESSLIKIRLSYRELFLGRSYLTARDLMNALVIATNEGFRNIAENAVKFNLTAEVIADLRDKLMIDMASERSWIDEVNTFKKNCVLGKIKTKVLENFKKQVNEELPYLVGDTRVEYYETGDFRRKIKSLMDLALKSFQDQIPYQEDKISEAKLCREFDEKIVKIVRDLDRKNYRNKEYPLTIMKEEVDRSIAKYTNGISKVLKEDPIAEPYEIKEKHETLQELHIPDFSDSDTRLDDVRSGYVTQKYFEKTDSIFQEEIQRHSQNTDEFLNDCYWDLVGIVDKFVDREIAPVLQTRKISTYYINRIRESFNEQLEEIVCEIKYSTIANPTVVENIASCGKPISSESPYWRKNSKIEGISRKVNTRSSDISRKGRLIEVNIKLHTGKTFRRNVFNLWTVKMLRERFINCWGTRYETCSLNYNGRKLKEDNTLESYNVQDGDLLCVNIQ